MKTGSHLFKLSNFSFKSSNLTYGSYLAYMPVNFVMHFLCHLRIRLKEENRTLLELVF